MKKLEVLPDLPVIPDEDNPVDHPLIAGQAWQQVNRRTKRYQAAIWKGQQVRIYETGTIMREGGRIIHSGLDNRINSGNSGEYQQKRREKYIDAVKQGLSIDDMPWPDRIASITHSLASMVTSSTTNDQARVQAAREIRLSLQVSPDLGRGLPPAGGADGAVVEGLQLMRDILGKAIELKEGER